MHSRGITGAVGVAMVAAVVAAGTWGFVSAAAQDSTQVPVCAPPDGAPIWVPNQEQDSSARTDTTGEAREPADTGMVANGRIGGVFDPDTRIVLTGLDACEQRIDRSVVTTAQGWFLFTGLMPGRYALLDEDGIVLTRVDLTVEAPDRSGLELATA